MHTDIIDDELYIVFDSGDYVLNSKEIATLDDLVVKYAPCVHMIYKDECH